MERIIIPMKMEYYATFGNNGLGIYTDYDKVLQARDYIRDLSMKV